nr:unnamed protein product [Digitaria exilis]
MDNKSSLAFSFMSSMDRTALVSSFPSRSSKTRTITRSLASGSPPTCGRKDQDRVVVDVEVDVTEHRLRVPHALDIVAEEHACIWSSGVGSGAGEWFEAGGRAGAVERKEGFLSLPLRSFRVCWQALELPGMSASNEKWIDGLQFTSLFCPPPQDVEQKKAQILAYVEFFGQFTADSEQFPEDIAQKEYSEQWALACGEILRVLTHYNRPIFKVESQHNEAECSSTSDQATSNGFKDKKSDDSPGNESDRKPLRPLTPWITDILLAAPLGIRSDYFRWCGGVMGKYAAGGELKPPTTACSRGSGKHPQLMPSTPRWAVANGAGVILSVCDEEVARYETANLTAAAVPALLLPPPTTPLDEHLVAGLPPLEPYARLYYAIATPSATQRLLFGLLEAPPSWAPDALDAAVQLVELLRAAEDYATGMRLPKNWMHLHFLRAIGTAMSMRAGIAADTAAALLFRILSQPTLLFPPLRHAEGVEVHHEPLGGYVSSYKRQLEVPASEATIDATAQGIASLLCAHGPDVEWRICTIWEAAYEEVLLNGDVASTSGKVIASLQVEASDLANFLTMDRNGGHRGSQTLLRSVLSEKQELCFSVVSLLWQKLIASPEMQMSAESTSAHQGWRKVVDALCDVVSASPTKASAAIVLQADKDLQPWIARDDEQGQKMWRVNQRIVKLIAELMRNHDSPEALVILASASDLLLRATDGMLVDGEACTLPQLELLEVTARAAHLIIEWGDSGLSVADGLSNLLKACPLL